MLADYNTTQKKQINTVKRIDDIENSTFVLFDDNRTQKLGEDEFVFGLRKMSLTGRRMSLKLMSFEGLCGHLISREFGKLILL